MISDLRHMVDRDVRRNILKYLYSCYYLAIMGGKVSFVNIKFLEYYLTVFHWFLA